MSNCCNQTAFGRFKFALTWGVGSIVILLLRLYVGWIFMKSGYHKLSDIPGTAQSFSALGIIHPEHHAWIVGLCETIGGALLFVGLFARLVSIPLAIIMIAAYWFAHHEGAVALFSNPELFMSQPAFFPLLTSLLVFAYGAGYFSLDCLLFCRKKKAKADEVKPIR